MTEIGVARREEDDAWDLVIDGEPLGPDAILTVRQGKRTKQVPAWCIAALAFNAANENRATGYKLGYEAGAIAGATATKAASEPAAVIQLELRNAPMPPPPLIRRVLERDPDGRIVGFREEPAGAA